MTAWFASLSTPAKVAVVAVGGTVLLVGLILLYDWVGTTFLDTGGTVG